MGHTNSTANLSLPQFIGTDKPTWLGDVNGAFSAIDSYAGTNDAAVAAAASDASSAISQAAAAVNTANTANTTAGNASTAANNAVGVANNAVAIAGVVDGKVGLLADLNTTDRTSIVNAINEVNGKDAGDIAYDNSGSGLTATNVQAAIDEVAQGGGGAGYTSHTINDTLGNSYATIAGYITGCDDAILIMDNAGQEFHLHLTSIEYNVDTTFRQAGFSSLSATSGPNLSFIAIQINGTSLVAASAASITSSGTCTSTDIATAAAGYTVKKLLTM